MALVRGKWKVALKMLIEPIQFLLVANPCFTKNFGKVNLIPETPSSVFHVRKNLGLERKKGAAGIDLVGKTREKAVKVQIVKAQDE